MAKKMWCGLALVIVLLGVGPVQVKAADLLDDGLLDPAWFGAGDIEFRHVKNIDYFWVAPGFSLKGSKIHVDDWSDPVMLAKKKRDAKDTAKAVELTESMPGLTRGALMTSLDGVAEVSRKQGDLVLTGRIVDCNAGSKAAKWLIGMGAGSASATWDMKLVDSATGKVVLAIHHRSISGTSMSDINDKIIKWLEELGDDLKGDLGTLYQTGKRATK